MPPEEIEAAKRDLDPDTFAQEYEADFVTSGALVARWYTETNRLAIPFSPTRDTWLCWDFNTHPEKPMFVGVNQSVTGERLPAGITPAETLYCFTHEFAYRNTRTEEMCQAIRHYLAGQGFAGRLTITGDYAGNSHRSSAALTDYEIIRRVFPEARFRLRPTLHVRDRVAAMNAAFRSYDGATRQFVNPTACPYLDRDLRLTEWKENGVELNDAVPERTHGLDGCSYFHYNFYPIDAKKPVVTMY